MTTVIVDDHLLGDLIAGVAPATLVPLLRSNRLATTNLYYYRLCRAALAGRGGALTSSWSARQRQQATRELTLLGPEVAVLPMREIAFRMGELARDHSLSALGAEAVAAAERERGVLCVWEGDDGPRIRACCDAAGVEYQTITRD
ncbi:MAG: hypothetical protein ACRDY2_11985 [Acidimicrobiales bacterium]